MGQDIPIAEVNIHLCARARSRNLIDQAAELVGTNPRASASRPYGGCPSGTRAVIDHDSLSMGHILAQETFGSMRRDVPRRIPAVVPGRLARLTAHGGERESGGPCWPMPSTARRGPPPRSWRD